MSSYFDDASLVMIPSGYKTSKVYSVKPTDGSGDLTFSRSNDTATRVNSAGLIEKVRTNLVLQSETFDNASWAKTFGASITANTAANPLTGTQTADTIYADATNDFHYISQSITYSAGEATLSIYAKANGYSWFVIDSGFSNAFGYFNLTTGAVGLKGSASTTAITSVGNGWYRCSVTFTATASASSLFLSIRNADNGGAFLGDGVSGFFIYGAQAEMGVATDYIATTTAAVSVGPVANVPRLDYLNSSCPRLLLEPQRTNALTNSENFSSGYFTTDVTVTSNTSVSPDGYTSADTITEGTANDLHRVGQNFSAVSGSVYTASIFCKAGSGTRNLGILFGCGFGEQEVVFNVNNGTIVSSSGATGTITNYGNGWYRCTATATSDSTTSTCAQFQLRSGTNQSYAGNGTSSLIYWGAQVEAGAYATSYIPTLGAAVTRGADECSKTGISSLIGQTEGTLFVETTYNGAANSSQFNRIINITDGSLNNFIAVSKNSGTAQLYVYSQVGGAPQVDSNAIANTNLIGTHKIAFAYKANDFVLYVDGVQRFTDTSGLVAACSQLNIGGIGALGGGADQLGGSVNQAILFKTRLTNAQLAELTTI